MIYEFHVGNERVYEQDLLATVEGLASLFAPMENKVKILNEPLRLMKNKKQYNASVGVYLEDRKHQTDDLGKEELFF